MGDSLEDSLPRLSQSREKVIAALSEYFANDALTLDELERRIERAYKATTGAELAAITADLVGRAPSPMTPTRVNEAARSALPSGTSLSAAMPSMPASRTPSVAVGYTTEHGRMLAIMGETRRKGRWAVPQQLEVMAVMADVKLDLTQAMLPPGVVEIHINCMWAACKITVPRGMRVVNEMHAIMASVRSNADELPESGGWTADIPVIRLTGMALMGEVKVVVDRRR